MDPRHTAYTRRLEKTSHREKTLGALAVLGVAIGVAGVLAPPLDIRWPGVASEPNEAIVGAGALPNVVAAAPAAAQQGAARRVYPYSIIPGGVADKEELARIIRNDRTVAAHYAGFDVANARAVVVTAPRAVYVSYRKGEQVYWTRKKLMLQPGETLLTDGKNEMRARCANRISDVPMFPVEAHGPTESELDSFVTEGTVEGSSLAVAAAPLDGFGEASGSSYQTRSFPNGAGLVPPAAQPRPSARSPGAPGVPGSYRPGVSNGGILGGTETPRDGGTATTPVSNPPASTPPATSEPTGPATPEVPAGDPVTPPANPELPPADPAPPTSTPELPPDTPALPPGDPAPPTGTPELPPGTPGLPPGDPAPPTGNPELPPETPGLPPGDPGPLPDVPVTTPGDPTEVPEPGTLWLGGAAFAAMLWMRRRGARARR